MDFQTILAIVIVGAVIFFVMKKRKDKKVGGSGRSHFAVERSTEGDGGE